MASTPIVRPTDGPDSTRRFGGDHRHGGLKELCGSGGESYLGRDLRLRRLRRGCRRDVGGGVRGARRRGRRVVLSNGIYVLRLVLIVDGGTAPCENRGEIRHRLGAFQRKPFTGL